MREIEDLEERQSPLAMSSDEFRLLGHQMVNRVADFLDSLPARPVTTGESTQQIRDALDVKRTLPKKGSDPAKLISHAADLLFDHSLSTGTRAFGVTSRHRLHPSVRWRSCWPPS